jgi:hypothetical protein
MGCGFPTVCGVVASLSASPPTQRKGNRWKPLVSLAGRASCSCFVRLCVSEERFVTSGQFGTGPDALTVRLPPPSMVEERADVVDPFVDPNSGATLWAKPLSGSLWVTPNSLSFSGQPTTAPVGTYTYQLSEQFNTGPAPTGSVRFSWLADNFVQTIYACPDNFHPPASACTSFFPSSQDEEFLTPMSFEIAIDQLPIDPFFIFVDVVNLAGATPSTVNPTGLDLIISTFAPPLAVPEPSSLALLGTGAAGLLCLLRRFERRRRPV